MSVSKPKQYALAILASIHQGASAFTSPSATSGLTSRPGLSVPAAGRSSPPATTTSLASTVDPSTITKKEYQDICGVDFDDTTLADRLARTNYLYPKHVEVIEDFAPLVDKMVDEIVSISAGKDRSWKGRESRRKTEHVGVRTRGRTVRGKRDQNSRRVQPSSEPKSHETAAAVEEFSPERARAAGHEPCVRRRDSPARNAGNGPETAVHWLDTRANTASSGPAV